MRGGACTVQQALSPEAAAVVKQAVSLARRRGNAQVTPLHVASAMLHHQQQVASSPGLLRAACLRSHSHPLQCKALELCFNVALNRLPTTSASPLLLGGHGHVYYPPSLSNALVAAFKRAQAHQRRGSVVDTQPPQQPVLAAVRIELEQLVISILDDPSVSRVMREAGFSSTQVKANVEQAVVVSSIEANNTNSAAAAAPQNPSPSSTLAPPPPEETKQPSSKLLILPLEQQARDEDVAAILDCLASRSKRRVVVVAECAASAEAATRAAVDKIKRGEALRLRGAQVVSLSVSRFRGLARDEAERMLVELRCAVKLGGRAGGVVLVVEDLVWAAEFWAARAESRWPSSCCYYCPVEHAVAEVRALACRGGDGVWLVGYGTYQSYMRCRAGQPSLESLWGLQTLAVPAGSLALSLNFVDEQLSGSATAMAINHGQSMSKMAKCDDDDDDTRGNGSAPRCLSLLDGAGGSSHLTADDKSSIPPWLQHCQDQVPSRCKKSSTCGGSPPSSHHRTAAALNFSTVVSPSSSSVSSYEQHYHLHHQPYQPWLVVADAHEAKQHPCTKASRCAAAVQVQQHAVVDDEDVKLLISAIKVKSHDSDSSASNGSVVAECRRSRFKELSAENLKVLCSALEREVPWQAAIVPEIASTVLRCRSGMARRRRDPADDASSSSSPACAAAKEDTWMLFHGGDAEGKARVARELARLVFGSRNSFVSIGAGTATASSSPARSDAASSEQQRKRPRLTEEASSGRHGCHESLYEAVRDNPHRVILVEDVEQFGCCWRCQRDILEAITSGLVRSHAGGDEVAVALGDAIVVLSCQSFDAWSTTSSPPTSKKKAKAESEEDPKEEESTGAHGKEEAVTAAAVSPPLSSPCFDLNMDVENDDLESCFTDASLLKAVDGTFFFRRPDDETSD